MRKSGWIAAALTVITTVALVKFVNGVITEPELLNHILFHLALLTPVAAFFAWVRAQDKAGNVFVSTRRLLPRLLYFGLTLFIGGAVIEIASVVLGQKGLFDDTHEAGWWVNEIGVLTVMLSVPLALIFSVRAMLGKYQEPAA